MAKQSGLGDNLYVSGFDVSGDVGSLGQIHGGPAALEVTAINRSAFERLGGLRDGGIDYAGFFNDDVGQLHRALRSLPVADRVLTYCRGVALGGEAACLVSKQAQYSLSRGTDGSFTITSSAVANGFGLEWGNQLTPGKITHVTGTTVAAIDTLASSSFGGQAYLQSFALTGTNAVVTISDSADNVTFAPVAGFAFTSVTSGSVPGAERIQLGPTATLRRFIRLATSGIFTSFTFSVVVVDNQTTTVF